MFSGRQLKISTVQKFFGKHTMPAGKRHKEKPALKYNKKVKVNCDREKKNLKFMYAA